MELKTIVWSEIGVTSILGLSLMLYSFRFGTPILVSLDEYPLVDSVFSAITSYHVMTHIHAISGLPFPGWSQQSSVLFGSIALFDLSNFLYLGFVKNIILAQGMAVAHVYFSAIILLFPKHYEYFHDYKDPYLHSHSDPLAITLVKKSYTAVELGIMVYSLFYCFHIYSVLGGGLLYGLIWQNG